MDPNEVMPWGFTLAETGVVLGGIFLILLGFIMLRFTLRTAVNMVKSLIVTGIIFIFLCGLCGGVAYWVFTQQ